MLEELDTIEREETTTAPAWKNLLFMKDGRTVFGHHVYPTKEAAHAASIAGEAHIKWRVANNPNGFVYSPETGRFLYYYREYAYCIQVPWTQEGGANG